MTTEEALAILVHDLRAPLGAIVGSLCILRHDRAGDAAVRRAADLAERQVGHVMSLIDGVLDLTRAWLGKVRLYEEWLDVAAAAAEAEATCRPVLDRRKHRLSVTLPPSTVWLRADPTRLQQILVNLLTNAAKYTEPGGHIRLIVEETAGGLVVRVQDNGVGIAPDVLPQVFDLFEQGPSDLGRDGLGVGLALVRWLVELHGGTVSAHSGGPGTGSEFIVRLPARSRSACSTGTAGTGPFLGPEAN